MLKKGLILLTVMLFFAASVAQAQVNITYSSQGKQHFTVQIPDSWRVNVGFEVDPSLMPEGEKPMSRLITAMPNDGTDLWFGMWVPPDVANFEEAHEYMSSLDSNVLTDVVPGEHKSDMLNGMKVYYANGTGKRDDALMEYHGMFIQLSPETVAIAIYIGPPETTKSHGKDLLGMMHSLQPVTR